MPLLFCLPFATVHPFLVIFISISTEINSSFQRRTWFAKLRPGSIFSFQSTHRHCNYIPHIMPCFASCCLRIAPWLIVFPLLVFLPWVEPGDEYVIEEPIENAYEDQAYVNSENFAGKMTIPSKSLLSLLASCSLHCDAYATIPTTCFTMPPILPCQTSNPPCPSKLLFGYVIALLSPSYNVASCS